MTLKQALARARAALAAGGVEDAPLEAEIALRHALKIDRVQMYLDLDIEMTHEQSEVFWQSIERWLRGEPSAYITGHREFCGLDFEVGPAVLIPRPETEMLVEEALRLARARKLSSIADIGTGSGAIAVSLAVNLPEVQIFATDISAPALEVARRNGERHGVASRVCLLKGDLLEPLPGPVDLIIANMPYVRESELAENGFEPRLALDGGPDGLDRIRGLCLQVNGKLRLPGTLLLEIGQGQSEEVLVFLRRLFPTARTEVRPDLSGIDRVVRLNLTPGELAAKLDWVFPQPEAHHL